MIGIELFSPDGSKLASGSYDKTVRVWNVATGQVKQDARGPFGLGLERSVLTR